MLFYYKKFLVEIVFKQKNDKNLRVNFIFFKEIFYQKINFILYIIHYNLYVYQFSLKSDFSR